ncbi:MAG: hypothetical protein DMF95_26325 [Acidobacteria bacterium]|nr:MAG: hypothetical protein DMF95_26325 [Acidobacteriota bacterium]
MPARDLRICLLDLSVGDRRTAMDVSVRWDLVTEVLRSEWTDVGGRRMHARVPATALPPIAPVVVLVHGIGVSSGYMVPTAIKLAETCHV